MSRIRPHLPSIQFTARVYREPTEESVLPITMINRNLFIGSVEGASSSSLEQHNITHVVSLYGNVAQHQTFVPQENVIVIDMDDCLTQSVEDVEVIALPFIRSAVKDDGRIFIHCQAGVSRSATIAASYLIEEGMSFTETMNLLRNRRSCVQPNFGFEMYLRRKKCSSV